jgi:hypothetical protein
MSPFVRRGDIIKKTITLNNPCNLLEKLFDSQVVPTILYGSEVWGIGNK